MIQSILIKKIGSCCSVRVVSYGCFLSVIATERVRNRFESFLLEKLPLLSLNSIGGLEMRKEYDFSHSVRNPYLRKLKKVISIRIDPDTIGYFKQIAEETGIPYQNLMNHYLADCASKGLKPSLTWQKKEAGARRR